MRRRTRSRRRSRPFRRSSRDPRVLGQPPRRVVAARAGDPLGCRQQRLDSRGHGPGASREQRRRGAEARQRGLGLARQRVLVREQDRVVLGRSERGRRQRVGVALARRDHDPTTERSARRELLGHLAGGVVPARARKALHVARPTHEAGDGGFHGTAHGARAPDDDRLGRPEARDPRRPRSWAATSAGSSAEDRRPRAPAAPRPARRGSPPRWRSRRRAPSPTLPWTPRPMCRTGPGPRCGPRRTRCRLRCAPAPRPPPDPPRRAAERRTGHTKARAHRRGGPLEGSSVSSPTPPVIRPGAAPSPRVRSPLMCPCSHSWPPSAPR